MSDTPDNPKDSVSDGGAGRDRLGRFTVGNRAARGNPYAAKIAAIRSALMEAADPEKIKAAVMALLDQAVAGDRAALAEILDRTIGKPVQADLLERIEWIESQLEQRNGQPTQSTGSN